MNRILLISLAIAMLTFFSCKDGERRSAQKINRSEDISETVPTDFNEQIVNVVIENSSNKKIEFLNLYDSLTSVIRDDKDERLVLVQMLKKKGFKVESWGRGNYPPLGARIVSLTMLKDDCECQVNKIYYLTHTEFLYEMRESINCKKVAGKSREL